jgi:hypothetical protein
MLNASSGSTAPAAAADKMMQVPKTCAIARRQSSKTVVHFLGINACLLTFMLFSLESFIISYFNSVPSGRLFLYQFVSR